MVTRFCVRPIATHSRVRSRFDLTRARARPLFARVHLSSVVHSRATHIAVPVASCRPAHDLASRWYGRDPARRGSDLDIRRARRVSRSAILPATKNKIKVLTLTHFLGGLGLQDELQFVHMMLLPPPPETC